MLPPNYFTCTLGEAAQIKTTNPSSITFNTINELLDYQASIHPDRPAAAFPIPSTNNLSEPWRSEVFSFKELKDASTAIAALLVQEIARQSQVQTCVALLCPSSIEFLFVWLALIRAGYPILLIAPQCQPEAIAELCKACEVSLLLYHNSFNDISTSAVCHVSSLIRMPIPWQLSKDTIGSIIEQAKPSASTFDCCKSTAESVAYIHHTSGTSSGLPKPIRITHHAAVRVLPCLPPTDKATFTTTPLYHGGIADCFRAWTSSDLIWLFPEAQVPITEKHIISSLSTTLLGPLYPQVRYFSSVPYVLQMMASDDGGMKWLQKMDIVGVGGASLPESMGDDIVRQEIKLASRFGSTECGFLLSSHRDYDVDSEWQYLRVPEESQYLKFERQDNKSGLAELVVLKEWPYLAKTNRDDGSFATSDLFQPHETIDRAWKYHSRSDNQITLITGKKFDPAPLEELMVASVPSIQDAFVFGNNREVPGILVFVKQDAPDSIADKVWLAIDSLNRKGQSHARIQRHMIVIMRYSMLKKSSKGTTMRRLAETTFEKEIESSYNSTIAEDLDLLSENLNVKQKVQIIVGSILGRQLGDHDDFYENGVDSASCTRIRALLQKCFLTEEGKFPWNVLYDCGNIDRLSQFIENKLEPFEENDIDKEMLRMVAQFSSFPNIEPNLNFETMPYLDLRESNTLELDTARGGVAILTGATGALGAYILKELLESANISQVYCLVRAETNDNARLRILRNLQERRISVTAEHPKLCCLASILHTPNLGLEKHTYQFLKENTTLIIHAAWPVNFSISLTTFNESFKALHNLLKLLFRFPHLDNQSTSRPTFLFCSSTASVIKSSSRPIPENISASTADASPLGYSRSKWVAEAICIAAAKQNSSVSFQIARIGQLTGDKTNGIWNTKEAYPLILSTVEKLACLPALSDKLEWLPFDTAAKAVIEIASSRYVQQENAEGNQVQVYHVVNKHTTNTFKDLLNWLKEIREEDFDIVEPTTWMDRLESVEGDHPAKALLGLWREAYGCQQVEGDQEKDESVIFSTVESERVSEVMSNVAKVDKGLVVKIWGWLEESLQGHE